MSSKQQPGWYNVPGKGRRYWDGKNYRFYGPSEGPHNKGQTAISLDLPGMWNNFVSQYGSSTSDPSKVGEQSYTKSVTPPSVPVPVVPYTGSAGNAGGAQSVDPEAGGYIPPTGLPLSPGTNTSTGKRDPGPAASDFKDNPDEAMKIWAQNFPELADRVIDKVETRGLQQSGYDAIKSVRQPQALSDSRESSAVDMVTMGMSPEDAVDFARTGQRETVFEPDGTVTSGGKIVKTPNQGIVPAQPLASAYPDAHKDAQAFFRKILGQQMAK